LKPRCIEIWFIETGACNDPVSDGVNAGIGAVLFNQSAKPVRYSSQKLTLEMISKLNPETRKIAIYECVFSL